MERRTGLRVGKKPKRFQELVLVGSLLVAAATRVMGTPVLVMVLLGQ